MKSLGKLYVCPTPIGNLEDITLRVLRTLREVDLIAAEDTRTTKKLLEEYKIKTPLTSYHEHNEVSKSQALLKKLNQGKKIALVSEAGMPGLSDPGYYLIKACLDSKINLEVLPGPSAAISALIVSGLPTQSFIYQGFLPRKESKRKKLLQELSLQERTLVFYESPHRIEASLKDMLQVLGDRNVALVRELTKKFEQILRGKVSEILQQISKQKIRGEIVIIVSGKESRKEIPSPAVIKKELTDLINKGQQKKQAIKKLAQQKKIPKRLVYEVAKDIKAKT